MYTYKLEDVLRSIQAGDPDSIYRDVSNKAAEWAICGFIEEANDLLDILWRYDRKNFEKDPRTSKAFQFMWDVSGIMPRSGLPFEPGDLERMEKENLDYFLVQWGIPAIKNLATPLSETEVDSLYVKAIYFCVTNMEPVEEILKSLKRFLLESSIATHYTHFQAATLGCLLAAQHGYKEHLPEFLDIWAAGYLKYPTKYTASFLMSNRSLARVLLTEYLAPRLSVTKSDCLSETKAFEEALKERSEKGRRLIYGHLSWKELLRRISFLSIKQEQLEFSPDVTEQQWLGYEPALLEDILAKEEELGIRFPADYKEFLLVSNGFRMSTNTAPTFCPVHEVVFLRDKMPEMIDGWKDLVDEVTINSFRQSILIGGVDDEQQMFLGPIGDNNWVCWFFAYWMPGEWQYQSLRFYMEYVLQGLENEEEKTEADI